MNFPDESRAEAEMLSLQSRLVTHETRGNTTGRINDFSSLRQMRCHGEMEGESPRRCVGGVGLLACEEDREGQGERERRRKGVVEAQLVGPLTIDDNDDK
jgi:hypothetical protein